MTTTEERLRRPSHQYSSGRSYRRHSESVSAASTFARTMAQRHESTVLRLATQPPRSESQWPLNDRDAVSDAGCTRAVRDQPAPASASGSWVPMDRVRSGPTPPAPSPTGNKAGRSLRLDLPVRVHSAGARAVTLELRGTTNNRRIRLRLGSRKGTYCPKWEVEASRYINAR